MTHRVNNLSWFVCDSLGFSADSAASPCLPESWGLVTLAAYQGLTSGHDHHSPEGNQWGDSPLEAKISPTLIPPPRSPPHSPASTSGWTCGSFRHNTTLALQSKIWFLFLTFSEPGWFTSRCCRKFRKCRENVKEKILIHSGSKTEDTF